MAEENVLSQLDSLLDLFFSTSSTNEQKAEINKLLENFSQQQGVWHYCVYFLRCSKSQHVLMYSLNILETLVTQMWVSLSLSEKAELRHFLMQHLITNHTSMLSFIRNKLVKVIVLIGRSDWPHNYPEFFAQVQQLLHNADTSTLGLIFVMTMSEELACPSSDLITSRRRDELSMLMKQQVPTLLSLLMNTLNSIAEKQQQTVTPTPPPSPNVSPIKELNRGSPLTPPHPYSHSPSSSSLPSPFGTPQTSHLQVPTITITAGTPTQAPPFPHASPIIPYLPLDSKTEETCILSLKCLCHLFSWMPLSNVITPSILDTIFHFASLGCDSISDATENAGNLGSLAMDCVNELLVKNCVPREFEAFLLKLFEKSFCLLQKLTGESERGVSCNFSKLDDRFLAKCSDFFYWFVSSHLKRVEFNPLFPVLEFLGLFYKYTFKQPGIDSFCVCLVTWGVFLDHLIMMSSDSYGRQSPPPHNHYERYKDVLVSMMESVLQKIQLHFNIDELREIDDDTIDDDNETEWQSFLRQSLEFVGKVAELFPSAAFQRLFPLLEGYSQIYLSLEAIIQHNPNGTKGLRISEGAECEKLHAVLKDLTSILQAIGRLSEHFIGDYFASRFADSQAIVEKLCLLARYSQDMLLFTVKSPMPEILDHDFIELHAQILGTLQAFSHWLCQLNLDSLRNQSQPALQETTRTLVTSLVHSVTPLIQEGMPEKVLLPTCQLLLSLVSTVKPRFMASLPNIQELEEKAAQGKLTVLPNKAYAWVYRALSFMLILPWPEVADSNQEWERRGREMETLMLGATGIFRHIQQNPGILQNQPVLEQAKPSILQALILLEDLISAMVNERPRSKTLLFKSISSCVDVAISLFPAFLVQPEVLDLLMSFFLTLFGCLKSQVGQSLTEKTTQTFMTLLTKELLEQTFTNEASQGCRVIAKFLRILQLLVQDPTGADNYSLPSIISFTMKQIYPAISERPVPDIKTVFYELLYLLLLNNWRYFFPTNVLTHMDADDLSQSIEHEQDFFSIMESFGHSFLQPDITVFKQNLVSIEALNSKHKLYSKPQFQGCMLYPFLQLLLQVLVQKSHDILQEEICSCVYGMAAVDFSFFHRQFLVKFLGSVDGLTSEQQNTLMQNYKTVEDLPSFVQNVRQFTSDLRYFLILNHSSPAGSVKLT